MPLSLQKILRDDSQYSLFDVANPPAHVQLSDDLLEFARRVQRKITGAYFIRRSGSTTTLHVAVDGYPMTLGEIMTSTSWKGRNSGNLEYQVESLHINNLRGEKRVKASTSIATAVKNAARFLTKRAMYTIVNEDEFQFTVSRRRKLGSKGLVYKSAMTAAFGIPDSTLASDELIRMFEEGHHFNSGALQTLVADVVEKRERYKEEIEDTPETVAVVVPLLDRNLDAKKCAIVELKKKAKETTATYKVNRNKPVEYVSVNEFPQRIADALPMLDMMDDDDYLEGVGVRTQAGFLYIEVRD